ncbi:MAG: hypothetical protein DHS20C18_23650 [Saprospiraceae bacterium]|nr:MAG: hypothetical protein DHS20C18_23650 [Saprospiraceae bacterium]
MKYFLLLSFSILGFTSSQNSCTPKEQAVITNVTKEDLLGKWQWVLSRQERRGSGTTETTPGDLGKTMQIEFLGDEKLQVFHDGKMVTSNTYELTGVDTDNQTMLRVETTDPDINPNCESGPLYLQGKRLTISGGFNDAGSTQIFEKMH